VVFLKAQAQPQARDNRSITSLHALAKVGGAGGQMKTKTFPQQVDELGVEAS